MPSYKVLYEEEKEKVEKLLRLLYDYETDIMDEDFEDWKMSFLAFLEDSDYETE